MTDLPMRYYNDNLVDIKCLRVQDQLYLEFGECRAESGVALEYLHQIRANRPRMSGAASYPNR